MGLSFIWRALGLALSKIIRLLSPSVMKMLYLQARLMINYLP